MFIQLEFRLSIEVIFNNIDIFWNAMTKLQPEDRRLSPDKNK